MDRRPTCTGSPGEFILGKGEDVTTKSQAIRIAIVDNLDFAARMLRRSEDTPLSRESAAFAMRRLYEAWGLTQALMIVDRPPDAAHIRLTIVRLQLKMREWL